VVPSDEYDLDVKNKARFPFVLIDVDIENDTILAEVPARTLRYVIPRWATISGSQYAYSPATVYALPDARMLQQITLTMLEAGQKATDPPMIAVTEAINGGVNSGAGMITWTDADYDERTGEVLRPMEMRFDGIRYGAEREERIEGTLDATFFLNQIRMPQITKEMTAYEASKLYEEFSATRCRCSSRSRSITTARCATNGTRCRLQGSACSARRLRHAADPARPGVRWEFDTPLKAAAEQAKVFAFQNVTDIIAKGMQIDPDVGAQGRHGTRRRATRDRRRRRRVAGRRRRRCSDGRQAQAALNPGNCRTASEPQTGRPEIAAMQAFEQGVATNTEQRAVWKFIVIILCNSDGMMFLPGGHEGERASARKGNDGLAGRLIARLKPTTNAASRRRCRGRNQNEPGRRLPQDASGAASQACA
jgi:hypothetical protein